MAKKSQLFGLKFAHKSAFRRTVKVTKEIDGKQVEVNRYQLLFEPMTPYALDAVEQAACKDIIDGGLLVPWEQDDRGRRITPEKSERAAEGNRAAELELEVAALEEQVALLIEQVKELGGDPVVEAEDAATEEIEPIEPTEEKPSRRGNKKTAADATAAAV